MACRRLADANSSCDQPPGDWLAQICGSLSHSMPHHSASLVATMVGCDLTHLSSLLSKPRNGRILSGWCRSGREATRLPRVEQCGRPAASQQRCFVSVLPVYFLAGLKRKKNFSDPLPQPKQYGVGVVFAEYWVRPRRRSEALCPLRWPDRAAA